jgi:hypothetical protein
MKLVSLSISYFNVPLEGFKIIFEELSQALAEIRVIGRVCFVQVQEEIS